LRKFRWYTLQVGKHERDCISNMIILVIFMEILLLHNRVAGHETGYRTSARPSVVERLICSLRTMTSREVEDVWMSESSRLSLRALRGNYACEIRPNIVSILAVTFPRLTLESH